MKSQKRKSVRVRESETTNEGREFEEMDGKNVCRSGIMELPPAQVLLYETTDHRFRINSALFQIPELPRDPVE